MDDFPGNANRTKGDTPGKKKESSKVEPRKHEAVVSGSVSAKKKTFGDKVKGVFMGAEIKSVARYIAADVLLPALRNMVVEGTSRGIEQLIYGDKAPARRSAMGNGRGRMSYDRIADRMSPRSAAYLPGRGEPHRSMGSRNTIEDLFFERREDIDVVLDNLVDVLDEYDFVTVAELYQFADLPYQYTDTTFGWSSIKKVEIQETRDGYILMMPRVESL